MYSRVTLLVKILDGLTSWGVARGRLLGLLLSWHIQG